MSNQADQANSKGNTMADNPRKRRKEFREEAKIRYRDPKNIEAKWLDQYGNINREDDYQRNRTCLTEVFNMLDVVMENCIDDFRHSHVMLSADPLGPHTFLYSFEGDNANTITFRSPSTFAGRAAALRNIGYTISDDLFYETRLLRNETTHGNQTIILQHMQLSYADTIKAMLSMADTLIELGMLDPKLRIPPFERLRIHEGETLGGGTYTIGALLGEGGMSRVYKATQIRVGRELAVKELKPDTYSDELIGQECALLMKLHHEQIPQIHDVFYENATWYIVMSIVDGETLDRAVKKTLSSLSADKGTEPLTEADRLSIGRTILNILEYLHGPEVNIVYVDLSPDNIMLDREKKPHLIDFGISSQMEARQFLPAATLGYSAPEVFSREVLDQRADIYSFGYLLRFLYTGLSPLERAETPTSDLIPDERIAAVINRCTARNAEERFADIAELKAALFPELRSTKPNRKGILITSAIAAAACVIGFGLWNNSLMNQEAEQTVVEAPAVPSAPSFEESGLEDHVMEWNDENLESAMREITDIPDSDLMLRDVWGLQELSLSEKNISDISALSELTNLTNLDLSHNPLENGDLSPLAGLTGLIKLDLYNCGITDLSPLAGLNRLNSLYLGQNNITDLTPLAGVSNLTFLDLQLNPVHNTAASLDTLSTLTGLVWLDLNGCGTSDLSFIKNLSSLQNVVLSGNEINDITSLEDLTGLLYLDLKGNEIDTLSPVSELTALTYLDVSNNQLSGDLHALENMTSLNTLDLHKNNISDISALKGLTSLRYLNLEDNAITDYSVLDQLTVPELSV